MHAIWRFVTDFGDTAVTVPLAVLMAGFLFAAKETRLAAGWSVLILLCAGTIGALKLVLAACGHPLGVGLSSPSGHTAMSIAVYGGFAAVAGANLSRWPRAALVAGTAALTIGVAVSRAILGYHSRIEVAVGVAVGSAVLAALVAIVARHRPQRLPIGRLAAVALVVALIFHGERWPAEQAIHRLAGWFDFLRPWCS